MPKTLITDLDRDTSPYNPKQAKLLQHANRRQSKQNKPKGFWKSTKCGHHRSSDKQHSIHKESQLTNKNYTKRGTSKPNPKKSLFPGLYTTVYKGNSRTIRDCPREQPAYVGLCTRLCSRATRVQVQNFSQEIRKIHKAFKQCDKNELGENTTQKLQRKD